VIVETIVLDGDQRVLDVLWNVLFFDRIRFSMANSASTVSPSSA
jgi:hypothetical protein